MQGKIYQLKVTIVGTRPPVWRRLLVPEATTLLRLHEVLQAAFGWLDCHLHEFEIEGVRYATDDGEGWGPRAKSESSARLEALAQEGTAFAYTYDFGDNWKHKVVVEKIIPAVWGVAYPSCIAGRRACPPEDCGGVWGYNDLIAAISDPRHPRHDSKLEWLGRAYEPGKFDRRDFAAGLKPVD